MVFWTGRGSDDFVGELGPVDFSGSRVFAIAVKLLMYLSAFYMRVLCRGEYAWKREKYRVKGEVCKWFGNGYIL